MRRALAIAGVMAAVIGSIAILAPFGADVAGLSSDGDSVRRAVILDQLSLTARNPAFAQDATVTLEAAGYEVTYLEGEQVTVAAYRELPRGDYDLVILRTHSTAEGSRGEEDVTSVSLFTNEPYSEEEYREEQLQGRLGFAYYTEDGPRLFGITADFIRDSMEGDFDDAIVLGMGCQGLINQLAAEAFADKGASTFIGWDGLVSAQHTDAATQRLLEHIVADGTAPEQAVALTMSEVGVDPDYGSSLVASP